jgi:uncharacterized protein YecE (DUF72 family)
VEAYFGVSGFSYPKWKGKFYPADLKSEDFLSYYCKHLHSVEINSSFYAQPSAAMVKNWEARADEDFRFAFKAPRLITHILKLGKGSSEAAAKFSKTLDLLGQKRGPVLFQLPPFIKFEEALLGNFLSETKQIEGKVFEFRHDSWFQETTYKMLKDNGAGFCIAETEDLKPVFMVTGPVAYFRLRKDSYDSKTVDAWAGRIREASKGAKKVFVYLRHDETGENALLAQRLAEKF